MKLNQLQLNDVNGVEGGVVILFVGSPNIGASGRWFWGRRGSCESRSKGGLAVVVTVGTAVDKACTPCEVARRLKIQYIGRNTDAR